MSSFSDFLENELLDHAFRNASYTPATTVYAAAYTVAPTDAGGGTEVANSNGYQRTAITFGTPAASGAITNTAAVTFPSASGGNWGSVVAIGIFDSQTYGAGNLLAWDDFTGVAINDGDTLQINTGDLDITLT